MKKILYFLLLGVLFIPIVSAEESLDLHIFYGNGCPHCANALTYLDTVKDKCPELNIYTHEVYSDEAERDLFFAYAESHSVEISGVPTFFINGKVFVGFDNNVKTNLEKEFNSSSINKSTTETIITDTAQPVKESITVTAVIFAAIVDAINPCAFAVLIILLSTVLANKRKKEHYWQDWLSVFQYSYHIF